MLGLAHLPRVAQYQLATPVSAEARGEQALLAHPDHLAVLDPVVAEHFADQGRRGPGVQQAKLLIPGLGGEQAARAPLPGHRLDAVPVSVPAEDLGGGGEVPQVEPGPAAGGQDTVSSRMEAHRFYLQT